MRGAEKNDILDDEYIETREALSKAEDKIERLQAENNRYFKTQQIMIAAGYFTEDKWHEAEAILDDLD